MEWLNYYDYWMALRQRKHIFWGKQDPDLNEPLLKLLRNGVVWKYSYIKGSF